MFSNFYFNKQYYNPYYFMPLKVEVEVDGGAYIVSISKNKEDIKKYSALVNLSMFTNIISTVNVGVNSNNNTTLICSLDTDSSFTDPNAEKRKQNNLLLTKLIIYT